MNNQYYNILNNLSNDNQKEIFQWLIRHFNFPLTPVGTWTMLFKERGGREPDKCIAIYDSLRYEEKLEVEYAFFEYAASLTKKSKQQALF